MEKSQGTMDMLENAYDSGSACSSPARDVVLSLVQSYRVKRADKWRCRRDLWMDGSKSNLQNLKQKDKKKKEK